MKCRPIIAWLGFRLNQKSNRSSQASSKKRDRRFVVMGIMETNAINVSVKTGLLVKIAQSDGLGGGGLPITTTDLLRQRKLLRERALFVLP
jgi:hypothetical protein